MNHLLFAKDIPHRLTLVDQTLSNQIKHLLSRIKHLLLRDLNLLLHILLFLLILLIIIIILIRFCLQIDLTTGTFNLIAILKFFVQLRSSRLTVFRLFVIWLILRIIILRKCFLFQGLILNSFHFYDRLHRR